MKFKWQSPYDLRTVFVELDPNSTAEEAIKQICDSQNVEMKEWNLVVQPNSRLSGKVVPLDQSLKATFESLESLEAELFLGFYLQPVFVKVGISLKGTITTRDILLDRSQALIKLKSILLECLPPVAKKGQDVVHKVTFHSQINVWVNSNISLEAVDFNPTTDMLYIYTLDLFKKIAQTMEKSTFTNVTKKGTLNFRKGRKKGKSVEQYFELDSCILHQFKSPEDVNPIFSYPLDIHNITMEKLSDENSIVLELPTQEDKLDTSNVYTLDNPTELAAWYDALRCQCRNTIDCVVFGQPIKLLASRNDTLDFIPQILRSSFQYLDNDEYLSEEGIFRKTGNIPLLNKLINEWDSGKIPDLSELNEPHVVASLVKRWLGRLPEPLVPFSMYDAFMGAVEANDEENCIPKILELIGELPLHHHAVLSFLVDFLNKTSKYEKTNLMGTENLATVIGPNVIRTKEGEQQVELRDSIKVNLIMKIMIEQHQEISESLKRTIQKSQQEEKQKQAEMEEIFQVTVQRSLEDIFDSKFQTSDKKKIGRRSTLTRQLSKRASNQAKRASTTNVASIWAGKLAPVPQNGPPVTMNTLTILPSQREKRTLPPPKGPTRTIQELEEILLQEMQYRAELEEMLQTEIYARQDLERKVTQFLLTIRDTSRLLSDPRQ